MPTPPLTWARESPPHWDADKARVLGAAPGAFDLSYRDGDLLPGEWWRVNAEGKTIGFGWMDTSWGDAEVLLAVAPEAGGRGVGSFILARLEEEARARGLTQMHNAVASGHPDRAGVTAWLERRGFVPSGDGRLRRRVAPEG